MKKIYFNQLTIVFRCNYKANKYKCSLSCHLKFGQFLFLVKFYTKVGSSQSIFSPKFIISQTINLRRTENNWRAEMRERERKIQIEFVLELRSHHKVLVSPVTHITNVCVCWQPVQETNKQNILQPKVAAQTQNFNKTSWRRWSRSSLSDVEVKPN